MKNDKRTVFPKKTENREPAKPIVLERNQIDLNICRESELIASDILYKIISMAMTNIFIAKVDEELPDNCMGFIKKVINSFVYSQFIPHDIEEKQTLNISKNESNLNFPFNLDDSGERSPIRKNNSKNSLISFDSEYTLPKFSNNYIRGENNYNLPDEPPKCICDTHAFTFIKSECLNFTSPLFKRDDNPNNETKKTTLRNRNAPVIIKQDSKNKNEKYASPPKKQKINLQAIMDNLSYHEISEEIGFNEEKDGIDYDDLRKEREKEIKKVEEEKKIIIVKEKEIKTKKEEEIKTIKSYKNKRLTTDVKGNIVFIRGYRIDSLSKEFLMTKVMTDNKKNIIKSPKKKNKTESNEESNLNTNCNNELETETEQIIYYNSPDGEVLPMIEKNGKIKPMVVPKLNVNGIPEEKEKRIKGPFVPVGSCYEIMSPEVGVIIKEESKSKSGGKDFFKRYNKFSIDNYNKTLKDTISLNMSNSLSHLNALKSQTYFGKSEIFNDTSTSNIFNKAGQTSRTNTFSKNSAFSPLSTFSIPKVESQRSVLKLKSDMFSFKNILQTDMSSKTIFNSEMNNTNIFKDKTFMEKSTKKIQMNLNDVNNFTKTILSNGWNSGIKTHRGKAPFFPMNPKTQKNHRRVLTDVSQRTREFRNTNIGFLKKPEFSGTLREGIVKKIL